MPPKKRANDVLVARGRLKGALHNVVGGSDDDSDSIDAKSVSYLPSRGRPPKRIKKENQDEKEASPPPSQPHQTFIMKLFDRSVDLAKYNENTSLYPVCRAWMINQPRSNKIINFKHRNVTIPERRKSLSDLLEELENGSISEVHSMPCGGADIAVSRIPSPLPFQKKIDKDNIDLNYDINEAPMSREDLLLDLKKKSTQVRKKWMKQTKKYQESKYSHNLRILEFINKQ